jgi:hypothetical protein
LFDGVSVMQLLEHPFVDEGGLIQATRLSHPTDSVAFGLAQRGADDAGWPACEHTFRNLFELIRKVGHFVGVPELGKFTNRIGVRELHFFFFQPE